MNKRHMSQPNNNNQDKENQAKKLNRPGRAKLKHCLMDVNLSGHNKIKVLKRHHGVAGKCAYYEIQFSMSKATNAWIEKDLVLTIAEENGVSDPESFFSHLLANGLIVPEMDGFSNEPVIKDQESYFRKLNSGQKKKISEQKCSGDDQKTTDSDIDIELDPKKNGLRLPEGFRTTQVQHWCKKWREKLKKSKNRDFDQIQLDALCSRFKTTKALAEALEYSCSLSDTKNVYPPPSDWKSSKEKSPDRNGHPPGMIRTASGFVKIGDIQT